MGRKVCRHALVFFLLYLFIFRFFWLLIFMQPHDWCLQAGRTENPLKTSCPILMCLRCNSWSWPSGLLSHIIGFIIRFTFRYIIYWLRTLTQNIDGFSLSCDFSRQMSYWRHLRLQSSFTLLGWCDASGPVKGQASQRAEVKAGDASELAVRAVKRSLGRFSLWINEISGQRSEWRNAEESKEDLPGRWSGPLEMAWIQSSELWFGANNRSKMQDLQIQVSVCFQPTNGWSMKMIADFKQFWNHTFNLTDLCSHSGTENGSGSHSESFLLGSLIVRVRSSGSLSRTNDFETHKTLFAAVTTFWCRVCTKYCLSSLAREQISCKRPTGIWINQHTVK